MSNNQMVSEILPCPYCGQQDFLIERLDSDASVVICQGLTGPHEACLARGPVGVAQDEGEEQPGRDKAIELWNARGEQQHGEPVACSHEWTDDGEFMLVCTVCGAQENHDPKWRDMATAPRDGTLVRLLVEFIEHATEDSEAMPSPTIGANSFDHTGEDLWQFAGWSWEQDSFTQGVGEPVGWLPLLDTPHADPAEVGEIKKNNAELLGEVDTLTAEVERLRAVIEQQKNLIESLRSELVESHSIDASAEPCAPELTDDLREILGRPNFTCHFIAKALRVMGHSIANKSEDEQAVVIHWLLDIYLKHGPDWRQRAAAELEEASQSFKPDRNAPSE